MKTFPAIATGFALLLLPGAASRAEPLVYNGSFEKTIAGQSAPDGWQTAGDKAVVQQLVSEQDPRRGHVARFTCTQFAHGTSSSHAMVVQMGHVGVKSGQWYRLRLWARASELQVGVVQVGLTNFRVWGSAGLTGSFVPSADWQPFDFVFQATRDLKPADSRLQIWFASTGTLWLDDVAIEEAAEPRREWLPVIAIDGAPNALPNSSFECGGEGWGCWSGQSVSWTAGVFRRMGDWDPTQAYHGKRSWKLTLSADKPLVLHAGGMYPVVGTLRSLLLGHEGWIRVQAGRPYVFSAYVKCDRPALPVRWSLGEAGGGRAGRTYSVGREWQRIEISYTPKKDLLWGFVGLDFPAADRAEGTLWIDAVQFERGAAASAYRPRSELEARVETGVPGNVLTDPSKGLCFRLRAYNDSEQPKVLGGRLRATDFWGRAVWQEKAEVAVGPRQSVEVPYAVLAGRKGFFRLHWRPEGGPAQDLRCAVIEPSTEDDAAFGFNHAFCQDFVLRLAHLAGMRWWRDWSAHWETVQPKPGPFDFRLPDAQVDYVLGADGRMVVLLPTSTAIWAAAPDPERVRLFQERRQKGQLSDEGLRRALTVFKPARLEDFAEYVRAVAKRYQGRVAHYEILNEPLYTSYSIPSSYGYKTPDYIDILRTAYQAAKSADPKCTVIGGIACWPGREWEEEFIQQGGLRWCDVSTYHWYPSRQRAEAIESVFKMRWEQMQKRGEAKPIWVTEFGLYADDDPAFTPFRVGDTTMNDTLRPDELTAAADMVQLAAVMCANGVRKIFYHAGVCQGLHDSSAGNVFFEYGGAPRKIYAAQAALARLLGPDLQFVRKWDQPKWLHAYEFRSRGRTVVVLWTRQADAPKLPVPPGLAAIDLMGNPLGESEVAPGEVPLYLVGK